MGKKTGKNPTDRGKLGVKRSTLIDGRGVPLAVAVEGANVPDQKLVADTLDEVLTLADSIIVMKDGCIVEQGFAEDIVSRPAEAYTIELMRAAFLSSTGSSRFSP